MKAPIQPHLNRFQDLVQHRVRHILLVSSLYDSFILTEDGQLNEALARQYIDLNLSQKPDLTRVSTAAEALELAKSDRRIDLILTSLRVADMNAVELTAAIREAGLRTPVILIGYNNRELTAFLSKHDTSDLERAFLWQGDVRILLAIVKYYEDRMNVAHDTGENGVPAILVVEDNVRYYSSFLPAIYAELLNHSHGLISEGLNLSQKMLRTRARPKILLCGNYEEAWEYFRRYSEQILGIISDIEFPKGGQIHKTAGVELASNVRRERVDVPIVLQSSRREHAAVARKLSASFLLKGSPTLLRQLRRILLNEFGFGAFTFRLPDGTVVGKAHDLISLVQMLGSVPAESIGFHGERNHFSNWLKARTEFALAERLRPRKVSEYRDLEHLRDDLTRSISDYRSERDRVIVADFDRRKFDATSSITRIGGGSLGGKARGLAFINRLLNESDVCERYPGVQISVPSAVVLGTDIFDQFFDQGQLRQFAIESSSAEEMAQRVMAEPFPGEALRDLRVYLEHTNYPLAVRSSGLLEDSPNQPFAGIYRTFMLPNTEEDLETRLVQLVAAVKRVYLSTFSRQAKEFLTMTPYRLEEEKMAVIIQRIVGGHHGNRFYPEFSGVGRSYNFYPTPPQQAEDGVVAVALGMGRTVVDGGNCLRFCPKYPKSIVTFSSADEVLRNSQREFYALDLDEKPGREGKEGAELSSYTLEVAEEDGTLASLASTYSPDNDVVYDGMSRTGVRVVSFAPILKHGVFPLAELLQDLLDLGSEGTSSPVEIEFAVNLTGHSGDRPEFGFLQMRPLALSYEDEELEIGHVRSSQLIVRSARVLGNGVIRDICDLVVVDFHRFDRLKSHEAAAEVARFNALLQRENRPYLLIGVGRWGSTDPHLGIPVSWNQIAGARVIVEAGLKDMAVSPSQGTHFFQNLTSCNVGYFTVNPELGEGLIDWEWLSEHSTGDDGAVRHVRLEQPILVKMSGKTGEGVILKPEDG